MLRSDIPFLCVKYPGSCLVLAKAFVAVIPRAGKMWLLISVMEFALAMNDRLGLCIRLSILGLNQYVVI